MQLERRTDVTNKLVRICISGVNMTRNGIRCINYAFRSDRTSCAFTPVDFWPSSNTETFPIMKYFLLTHNRHWCVYTSVMSFLCEMKSSILNGDKSCDTLLTPSYCGDLKVDSIFNFMQAASDEEQTDSSAFLSYR